MTDQDWFCVRTQPKHEHIATAHLRQALENIEVFNPKLRIRRATKRGAVWFVEALFPGYLFARFDPLISLQAVRSMPGVSTIVSFGLQMPLVPDTAIRELRAQFDQNEAHEVSQIVQPGDEVVIAGGPFHGLDAKVLCVLPAARRVQVLLEILGGCNRVEVRMDQIVAPKRLPNLN